MRSCEILGCDRVFLAQGMCSLHYQRQKKGRDVTGAGRPRGSEPERFWAKVDKTDTCWLWTAGKFRKGYGSFTRTGGVMVRAHRWTYEFLVGPIPDDMVIDHLCRVRHCVNPEHMEVVPVRINTLRGEGFTPKNAAKVSCIHGHEFDDENTYITRAGHRQCRACARQAARRYQQKQQKREPP